MAARTASTKLPATIVAKTPTEAAGEASEPQQTASPVERVIDVTQMEILEVLIRHQDLAVTNASLITVWPLCDDMADILMRIIGRRVE